MTDGRLNPNRPTDDELAAAIAEHGGTVCRIAEHFRVPRTTVNDWIRVSAALRRCLHDARESALDRGESSLHRAADRGDGWAVCFLLKTKGKSRGYVERADMVQVRAVFHFLGDILKAAGRIPEKDRALLVEAVRKAAAKRFPDVPKP